jgi:drug/metabolite transporter (DMT)-like permease
MSKDISGPIHNIGAVIGFGAMMLWVLCCFTLSNRKKKDRTNEKRIRNLCYVVLGILMIASLLLFVVESFNKLPDGFKTVFWAEILMLSFGGIACV